MTDTQSIHYQHDTDGRIFFIEGGHRRQVLNRHTFASPAACAVVHELNNAIAYGRVNGGTSTYRTDGGHIYVRYHPQEVEGVVPVYELLSSEQLKALAHELHQAGQMGAYT
ncbi:hypothetical protein [Nonomuraea turcica]|uniref:hypothetical protein n=1 Tax=Nonomuraea sp. G32 TaxID=3067274 RepID=UPI00273C4A6D|nr:hypothetical protein [Nonomuraea sp. G32]MDP4510318.1 hypothetical protein [Nonomuraea sp. G32]